MREKERERGGKSKAEKKNEIKKERKTERTPGIIKYRKIEKQKGREKESKKGEMKESKKAGIAPNDFFYTSEFPISFTPPSPFQR